MVGDEDEGVEEMPHRAVESAAVREAPVPTALIIYIYIYKQINIYIIIPPCICMHGSIEEIIRRHVYYVLINK